MRRRNTLRNVHHNYHREGWYFVTICNYNRVCIWGEIVDGKLALNENGRMIESVWKQIPAEFEEAELDEWILMPDHFHGIILKTGPTHHLSKYIQFFKRKTTNLMLSGDGVINGCKIWQRGYHDRIIRNEEELNRTRRYIIHNPERYGHPVGAERRFRP